MTQLHVQTASNTLSDAGVVGVRRAPVSIVSVWNNEDVRRDCLDRSINALRDTAPHVEYIPVDNRFQNHASAGAALNHGVRRARHEYVVFVQQDIYLHSLEALEIAAGKLEEDAALGMVGAIGITADGRIVGRIRDRVILLGAPAPDPVPVDSLDEVLFIVRRSQLLNDPLAEDAALAWHAYAVEYGLRLKSQGKWVGAMDIPMSHNSLSTNVARLDEAHEMVGQRFPDQLPLNTTCGTISLKREHSRSPLLTEHRWRWRWFRESLALRRAQRLTQGAAYVLSDFRWDVDRLWEHLQGRPLHVHNAVAGGTSAHDVPEAVTLRRREQMVRFTHGRAADGISGRADDTWVVTNLQVDDLAEISTTLRSTPHVVGHAKEVGYWVLTGPLVRVANIIWSERASVPSALLVRSADAVRPRHW